MRTYIFSFLIIASFIIASAPVSYAAEKISVSDKVLVDQLSALRLYVSHMLGTNTAAPSETELTTAIKEGALWLKRAQEENGHFRYEYLPYEDIYRNDDNIVRQAGALYALGEILKHDTSDPYRISKTVVRAIEYFENITKTNTIGEVSFGCIAKNISSTKCQLGATSLALIGMLDYVEFAPASKPTYEKQIHAYASFILAMQKDTGGFQDTYRIGRSVQDGKESPFSNGEALLALTRYYQYEKNSETKQAIDTAFTYLEKQPFDANLYLWIMTALKDMHTLWPTSVYETYAQNFSHWRMAQANRSKNPTRNNCAYAEGLVGALSVVEKDTNLSQSIRTALDRANRNNLYLQVAPQGAYRVHIEDGKLSMRIFPNSDVARGGFLTSEAEPTQRIDFTQHCINTFLQTIAVTPSDR